MDPAQLNIEVHKLLEAISAELDATRAAASMALTSGMCTPIEETGASERKSPGADPAEPVGEESSDDEADDEAPGGAGGPGAEPGKPTKRKNRKITIEIVRQLAAARGGRCLSAVYHNTTERLTWECTHGHIWDAIFVNVNYNCSWCPRCRINVGEEATRAALEEAFPEMEFINTRGALDGRLELDGYCAKLSLAFEYQGKQHYFQVKHFQTPERFALQLERDARTAELCREKGIALLIIPYTVPYYRIRAFIRELLLEAAVLRPELGHFAPAVGPEVEFYGRIRAQNTKNLRQYAKVTAVIKAKGGVCLSPTYQGYRVPLQIRCREGHVFEATSEAVCQGEHRGPRFCPECGGTRRQTDDELASKVTACGFRLLAVGHEGSGTRLRRTIRVACPAGHEYVTLWDNFSPVGGVPRKGCGVCHHAALGRAKRKGPEAWLGDSGIAVLGEYTTLARSYRWTCHEGHEFTATGKALQLRLATGGRACTQCSLADFARKNSLEVLDPKAAPTAATEAIGWRCRICAQEFSASRIALGRKKFVCAECSRPPVDE